MRQTDCFGRLNSIVSPATFTGCVTGLTSSGLAKVFVARISRCVSTRPRASLAEVPPVNRIRVGKLASSEGLVNVTVSRLSRIDAEHEIAGKLPVPESAATFVEGNGFFTGTSRAPMWDRYISKT